MIFSTKNKGSQAENRAESYLHQYGLSTLCRNFSWRQGEIDLIMNDNDTIVFTEVRLRNNPNFGSAAESVDIRKQQKIIKTAQYYLSSKKLENKSCRFDVISITGDHIEWIKQAFES